MKPTAFILPDPRVILLFILAVILLALAILRSRRRPKVERCHFCKKAEGRGRMR